MTTTAYSSDEQRVKASLDRWQRGALIVGLSGAVAAAAGLLFDAEQFFQSYLFAYIYWWVITVGCLGLALIYQMTGGRWGYASRPFFDSGIRTLPLVTLGFVPLALGLDFIYAWTQADYFAGNAHAHNRAWYLSEPFFLWRAAGYFAICLLFGFLFTTRVVNRDGTMRTQMWPTGGGLGAALLVLVVTFALIDWGMSLEPDWYSTIYGGLFVIGGLLTGLCVTATGVALTAHRLQRRDEVSLTVLHDLGKLLMAMVMLWAYFQFSQFMIVYAGNLPVEAIWYTHRTTGGWQWIGRALMLLHFAVPFCILLSAEIKRDPRTLAGITAGVLVIHMLDVFWVIVPSFHPQRVTLHWLDVSAMVGMGGLWLFEYFRHLKRRLVPVLTYWPHAEAAGMSGV